MEGPYSQFQKVRFSRPWGNFFVSNYLCLNLQKFKMQIFQQQNVV